jgi:hypothetical protein
LYLATPLHPVQYTRNLETTFQGFRSCCPPAHCSAFLQGPGGVCCGERGGGARCSICDHTCTRLLSVGLGFTTELQREPHSLGPFVADRARAQARGWEPRHSSRPLPGEPAPADRPPCAPRAGCRVQQHSWCVPRARPCLSNTGPTALLIPPRPPHCGRGARQASICDGAPVAGRFFPPSAAPLPPAAPAPVRRPCLPRGRTLLQNAWRGAGVTPRSACMRARGFGTSSGGEPRTSACTGAAPPRVIWRCHNAVPLRKAARLVSMNRIHPCFSGSRRVFDCPVRRHQVPLIVAATDRLRVGCRLVEWQEHIPEKKPP